MNIKKLMKKNIFVLLAVLTIGSFTCQSSHSKYIAENAKALQYNNKFNSISIADIQQDSTGNGLNSASDYQTIKYDFKFPSSNQKNADEIEKYTIVPANSECYVTSLETNSQSSATREIYLTSSVKEDISAQITCPINKVIITENGKEYVSFEFKIYEQFIKDPTDISSTQYLYTKGIFKQLKSTYDANHPEPFKDDIRNGYKFYLAKKNTENIDDRITGWLKEELTPLMPSTDYNSIISYINTNKNQTITNSVESYKGIKGLEIDATTDDNYIIITADQYYFSSYVLTHYNNSNNYPKLMYFDDSIYNDTTKDKNTIINDLFYYYVVNTLGYAKNSEQYNNIVSFINDKKAEYSVNNVMDLAEKLNNGIHYTTGNKYIKVDQNFINITTQVESLKTLSFTAATPGINGAAIDNVKAGLRRNLKSIITDTDTRNNIINENVDINRILQTINDNPANELYEIVYISYEDTNTTPTSNKHFFITFDYQANSAIINIKADYFLTEGQLLTLEYPTRININTIYNNLTSVAKNFYNLESLDITIDKIASDTSTPIESNIGTITRTTSVDGKIKIAVLLKESEPSSNVILNTEDQLVNQEDEQLINQENNQSISKEDQMVNQEETINYEYETTVSKETIKTDLDKLAETKFNITTGCNITLNELIDGTYDTNIGKIIIITDSTKNKKIVTITIQTLS